MSMSKTDFHLPSPELITTPAQAISLAIDWQRWAGEHALSYGELVWYQNYFKDLAERFNLKDQFKENGIL